MWIARTGAADSERTTQERATHQIRISRSNVANKALQKEGEDNERAGQVEGTVEDIKHAATVAVKDAKHALKEFSR